MSDSISFEGLSQGIKAGFGVEARKIELIRHNENITCRVFADNGEYALRVRKPVTGFTLDCIRPDVPALDIVKREAALLAFLKENGMNVQRPVAALEGGYIHAIDGAPATLYEWLAGETTDKVAHTGELGEQIGRMTAQMHRLMKSFDDIYGKSGYHYTKQLLPALNARISLARETGAIDAEREKTLLDTLEAIGKRFDELDAIYGEPQSVHGDLSPGNMLLTAVGVAPIDFSLSGESHIHMDIAGLLENINEPAARRDILRGYELESCGEVELREVEPYFALQIILFIACQYEKFMSEEWFRDALERWTKQTFAPLMHGERFLTVD